MTDSSDFCTIKKTIEPWYEELQNLLEACEKFEKHARIRIAKGLTGLDIVLVIIFFIDNDQYLCLLECYARYGSSTRGREASIDRRFGVENLEGKFGPIPFEQLRRRRDGFYS